MTSFMVKVPASSANLGPGFDSMGMAVNMYLTLKVTEQDAWEMIPSSVPADIPLDEHLIYQVVMQTVKKFGKAISPCRVEETSGIPLARGLGSSAAAIIAGIEIADRLGGLELTQEEKLNLATEIEGHPDNVAPALLGGLVISTYLDGKVEWMKISELDVELVAYIPEMELKTKAARDVLPQNYANAEAALASSIGNLTIAALMSGDFELAGKMMEKDHFHEPYRKTLIPNYDCIKRAAKNLGAYGTVISGAGPTMMSFVPKGSAEKFVAHFENELDDYNVLALEMDESGATIKEL